MSDPVAIDAQALSLLRQDQPEQAEALLRVALSSGSGPIALWKKLFHALREQGKLDEARQVLEMIVQTVPGDAASRFDLAELALLQGDFERGWREYRFRYKMEHSAMLGRRVQGPHWEGQPIPGKTLLIHDEQGFGDTFQFLRMVAWARQRSGARVVLEVAAPCYMLAARAAGHDQVILEGSLPPPFDYHCELMSLPLALGLQMSDLPGKMPYLVADPARVDKWRLRLADLPRPLVGLVWAGRPSHANDARRSLSLAELAPLARPGTSFLALQKGPAAEQTAQVPSGMALYSLSGEIQDFDDTAAILSLLNVLVSVDSSPVHLAGALGCPAWVMLPFLPDWRWLMQRHDSPWYPSLRLFRQPARGQWQPVLQAIGNELERLRGA
ncbi:tetratricopeptide repeat protein [Herbaspirillum sp. NPDC087042]|uniref:tetratricopeptide repeat protein n=1 Tax=Herbaspirillum sp. NPDC087042 TaxID=3364004 RepID=UPI00381721F0